MRFRPSDPGHEAVDKVLHVTDTTLDHWKMMPKLSPEEQKHRIKLMKDAGFFNLMLQLLDVPYGTYTLNMAYHATLIIRVLLKYPALGVDEITAEVNRQLIDVLFDEGIVTRLIKLASSDDFHDNEMIHNRFKFVNARDEASYAMVNIVYYIQSDKLLHRLVDEGARDVVCLAARTSDKGYIFLAIDSVSRLYFQAPVIQEKKGVGLSLKDQDNIMNLAALCNATENFCGHYDCAGSPNDRLIINIDDNTVEEDLSCYGVDRETCVERAAQNLAKANLIDDKDERMKTYIVDEWYRIPKTRDQWKLNIRTFGLHAAAFKSRSGHPINGLQDPKSPLKFQKLFDMLGRDDCCEVGDDMMDQLYHRKDVVRYIVDTLYDHNPDFLDEMSAKDEEWKRKEEELKKVQDHFPGDVVDYALIKSKTKEGVDNSHEYEYFLRCVWAMANEPGSSLLMSDVADMIGDIYEEETMADFINRMKFERRDVIEYMVSTLRDDFGESGFGTKMKELMNDVHNLPQISITKETDISDICRELTVQLLEIKEKNFELFRFAIFNVLLPQQRSPEETLGIISKELSIRKWKDSCLHKLSERDDLMMMIMYDLIKRDGENPPITTKERLKEDMDQVLYGASAVTYEDETILHKVFICIFFCIVVLLMYKSWQNQKRLEEEKKMREAEEARKKEKKAKRKKRQ